MYETLLNILQIVTHLISQQLYKIDNITILNFQMSKLRQKKVKQ